MGRFSFRMAATVAAVLRLRLIITTRATIIMRVIRVVRVAMRVQGVVGAKIVLVMGSWRVNVWVLWL